MNIYSNLGIHHDPKMANLGTIFTLQQRPIVDRLIEQYQDGHTRVDDDLSTHYMREIQHEIPGKGKDNPLQQRTSNTYMLFALLSPNKLTNILSGWFTCKVCHHTWFSNLNPPHNKYGNIHLRIDFINLNSSWTKKITPCHHLSLCCTQYLK